MAQHKLRVDNAGLIRLNWTSAGTININNVVGCMGTAGATVDQAMADALGVAIKSAYTSSNMANLCVVSHVLTSVSIRSIHQEDLAEFTSATTPAPGFATGDPLPRGVALVVTLRTDFAGKQNRGRMYLAGWNEAENDGTGNIVQAAADAALNFALAVRDAIGARGLQMAIVSRPLWQEQEPPLADIQVRAGHVHPVTGFSVRNLTWGSQRGREHRS